MGDPRLQGAAVAFAAAFLGFCAPASAQKVSAKSDTGVRAGAGAVVIQFEEKRSSRILYQEEKGGMVTSVAPPLPANVPEPLPAMALDRKAKSAVAPPKKAARKATT
jgi:hypothetical protein